MADSGELVRVHHSTVMNAYQALFASASWTLIHISSTSELLHQPQYGKGSCAPFIYAHEPFFSSALDPHSKELSLDEEPQVPSFKLQTPNPSYRPAKSAAAPQDPCPEPCHYIGSTQHRTTAFFLGKRLTW